MGFDRLLIANRGEIALRIARTARALGVRSVLACHPVDAGSPAARFVDEVAWLEGDEPVAAHLDAGQIVALGRRHGADAVHPGYGFLAENADFALAVTRAGLAFVGPSPEVIRLMGDKVASRAFVAEQGFRLSPSAVEEEEPASFSRRARELGTPLLVKASAGGGGKGMHIVREPAALDDAIERARREAERYFGDGRLYAERYVERPRHVEVQVLGDARGACLHLFERECSIQRRFQKLVEEAPAPGLDPDLREELLREAVGIANACGYQGAGTVEFIVAQDGSFSFLEMNTRLQVEHPVTELVTGVDLVAAQLAVAAGEPHGIDPEALVLRGHAVETRICAEEPEADFRPATGTLRLVREPSGEGVRFDSGVAEGSAVTPAFDPMLAKLAVHGGDRDEAVARARRALRETVLLGVATNAAYLERVLGHAAFARGELHTGFVSDHAQDLQAPDDPALRRDVVAAAALASRAFVEDVERVPALHAAMGGWRN